MVIGGVNIGNKGNTGKSNKRSRRRIVLILLGIALPILLACILFITTITTSMLVFGSLASSLFWDSKGVNENVVHKDENCECGCTWVSVGGEGIIGSTGSTDIGQSDNIGSAPGSIDSNLSVADAYNSLKGSKKKNLVYNMLPGAILSYEMFGVYPSVVMGQKVQESTWEFKKSNKHNYYGIKADAAWKDAGGEYHSVMTHEYVNGKKVYITADFRSYPNVESGVLAQGDFLRMNSRYSKAGVFNASNYKEQLQAIRNAGYATDPNYVKNIVDGIIDPNKFYVYDNIEESKEFMRDLGIYSKYEELKQKVISGEVVVLYKQGIANIGGSGDISSGNSLGGNNANNGDTSSNNLKGYWLGCNCERPCDLCTCHNNEDGNGLIDLGSGCSAWNMRDIKVGEASGLFGDRAYLESLIDKLGQPYAPTGSNVEELKKDLRDLLDDMGKTSREAFKYSIDKFKGSDGLGFIQYNQNRTPGEDYVLKGYNGGSTDFLESACGIYSLSMILSTLERVYVNPAEIAIVVQTLPVRLNRDMDTTQMGSVGALYSDTAVEVLKLAGYNVMLDSSLDKAKLDSTLEKGGLVLGVFKGQVAGGSTGHYMVIRDKDKDGNYLLGDSVKRSDTSYTFNQLKDGHKHSIIYVEPKAGKSVYDVLKDCNSGDASGDSSGSNQGIGNDIDPPFHPLKGQGKVSSSFFRSNGEFHAAGDWSAPSGTPIYAMWDGEVLGAARNMSLGNYVTIKHVNGYYTTSAHMSKVATKRGAYVKKGDLIGYVGTTGQSTGNHLHLELLTSNSKHATMGLFSSKEFVNPFSALNKGTASGLCTFKKMGSKAKMTSKGSDYSEYSKPIANGHCIVGS